MTLLRRFFHRKPPDRLLEIAERVFVFDCCFSTNVLDEDVYRAYINSVVAQLHDHYPDAAVMVFNFKEGESRSQLSELLSQSDMIVMDYPCQFEGCPLIVLEMINHFLRSSESWLSLEGQQNVLLMHCERGGWPVLAFMLACLLLYKKQYAGEMKALEMVYKQAPEELLHLLSPLNPQPSQLRYLHYISRKKFGSDWQSSSTPLTLDCIILRLLPLYNGGRGCRPVVRVYGQDPTLKTSSRSSKLWFSTSKVQKSIRFYRKEECELVKINIRARVQGDIVLECIHLEDDLVKEEMIFRVMFHAAFVPSNILMMTRDEVDVLWDAKDLFSREFRAVVLFSDADSVHSVLNTEESEYGNKAEVALPSLLCAPSVPPCPHCGAPPPPTGHGAPILPLPPSVSSHPQPPPIGGAPPTQGVAPCPPAPPGAPIPPGGGVGAPSPPTTAGGPLHLPPPSGEKGPPIPPGGRGGAPGPPAPPGGPLAPPPVPGLLNGGGCGLSRPMAKAAPPRRSTLKPLYWSKVIRVLKGSFWEELQRFGDPKVAPELEMSELETLFPATATVPKLFFKASKPKIVRLVELKRANNIEIMLAKVKMPTPDIMSAALAMDESILDADQVENLSKNCPTKEEMELLGGCTGDKKNLGMCEKYFLELMKVPRVESKLKVFLLKIQFNSQVNDFKRSLNTVNSACEEVRKSLKLKEVMKMILYLGNTLNQGTARGSALGFKLDSLLKLTDIHASNNKMTLMHYLCKVLASKTPAVLDFHKDLASLEASSKLQFKFLAEEMKVIITDLETVKKELAASEDDGPISESFSKTLKEFVRIAESEVSSVKSLYSITGRNADALVLYFGEDLKQCPFEQVTATFLKFIRMFRMAHEENCKQAALENRKARMEAEKKGSNKGL